MVVSNSLCMCTIKLWRDTTKESVFCCMSSCTPSLSLILNIERRTKILVKVCVDHFELFNYIGYDTQFLYPSLLVQF